MWEAEHTEVWEAVPGFGAFPVVVSSHIYCAMDDRWSGHQPLTCVSLSPAGASYGWQEAELAKEPTVLRV